MYTAFDEMPDTARIWVFQSTEFLNYEKIERISARLINFLEEWKAHGQPLKASFTIVYSRFVIVSLDEASYQATGCSIDKLTHFIQAMEKELDLSLIDRTQIAYRDANDSVELMHMNTFKAALKSGEFNEDTVVFNNLVETKSDFKNHWETPIAHSWHKQWLPVA